MARDTQEREALRSGTRRFVQSDPTAVALSRVTRQSDGAGGYLPDTTTVLPDQTVKMQPISTQQYVERSAPSSGRVVTVTHHMFGEYDLDVQPGDTFNWNGHKWEVVFVDDSLEYRTLVEVARSGD